MGLCELLQLLYLIGGEIPERGGSLAVHLGDDQRTEKWENDFGEGEREGKRQERKGFAFVLAVRRASG